jgi:outer membrane protein OmpA-like peptidoglycan-associated protein
LKDRLLLSSYWPACGLPAGIFYNSFSFYPLTCHINIFMKPVFALLTCLLFAGIASAQQPDTLRVHFIYNHSEITNRAAAIIDSCLQSNDKQYIIQQVELYGHCDSIGSHRYNDSLALARTASARQYLLAKNLSPVVFKQTGGFGKRQPLNSNTTEEERLLNRRVEIIIYKTTRPQPDTAKPVVEQPSATNALSDFIKDTTTKAGSSFILKNIHFQGGRHYLMPQSEPVLKELYAVLRDNPSLKIEIQGHVCCTAINTDGFDSDLRTVDLSVQRAKYIYQMLVRAGIEASRMRYKGFGGSRKISPVERNEEEKVVNRRVEIKILAK